MFSIYLFNLYEVEQHEKGRGEVAEIASEFCDKRQSVGLSWVIFKWVLWEPSKPK